MTEWIYLDHNATTPPDPRVVEAMRPYLSEIFGNPSSAHGLGRQARQAIDEARDTVAECLGAGRDEIVFTSGGTESINMVLKSIVLSRLAECPRVVISSIEHPATENAACQLEQWGCRVNRVPVGDRGQIDKNYLAEALQGSPALFSFILAESNTGTVQDGRSLIEMAREAGVPVHVDAVQAVGKMPINLQSLPADYLSFSAHKFYGPKGTGGLFVRAGRELPGAFVSGGGQEAGWRAGTENIAGIVGCGVAMKLTAQRYLDECSRIARLRRDLKAGLQRSIPDLIYMGDQQQCLPNTLCVSRPGISGENWVIALDMEKIAVSTGTACRSGSREPSRQLLAMGHSPAEVIGAVRLSLGRENSPEQVEQVVDVMTRIRSRMQPADLSSFSDWTSRLTDECDGSCPAFR